MAWFGEGLSSLSNLKGQITNFTKEVLAEGIVNEIDESDKELEETNKRCVQLQELLNSRDAEISILKRQNGELQKAIMELKWQARETNDDNQEDEGGGFFWDPPAARHREPKNQGHGLQEQLTQATLRIKELEDELKKYQKTSSSDKKDEVSDSHQRGEVVRVKQDLVNRIIQIGEKGKEAERNSKKLSLDESSLVNDFRAAISKLDSQEQVHLIRSALSALEMENGASAMDEKSDIGKKIHAEETFNGVSNRELELRKKIKKLQEENRSLSSSIEELDRQHAQSIDKVLGLKEDLQKKHHSLQSAYEALYVDFNKLQDQLSSVTSKTTSDKEIQSMFITSDQQLQTENSVNFLKETTAQEEDEEAATLQIITKRVEDILKPATITADDDETLFETLARRFVEVQWKKDLLERRMTDLTRELNQTSEIREAMQIDCEELQGTVEALEAEIRHMKSNLPSIPEASEERVASLETETESMSEEIKRLQAENDLMRREHNELITNLVAIEGSMRNQENLEAEVRNTKQQLEIAHQQLAGASKNVENNENMLVDLSRQLHTSLEENNELRKRIDALESREKQMQEQINIYSEKCNGYDENIELIEELKLDIGNVRKELKNSVDNNKRLEQENVALIEAKRKCESELVIMTSEKKKLEGELMVISEGKKEVERDLIALSQEKEQLETELAIMQKSGVENETSVLKELREQLDSANREKDDLEYDLLNMRKELDMAMGETSKFEARCVCLTEENERLVKEHDVVLEELSAENREAAERIEMLQTEMNLLQQEHTFLQEEAATDKSELSEMREKIEKIEAEYRELEATAKTGTESLMKDLEMLRKCVDRMPELEAEVARLLPIEEKWKNAEVTIPKLEAELKNSEGVGEELRKRCDQLMEKLQGLEAREEELKITTEKLQIITARCGELERICEEKSKLEGEMNSLKSELEYFKNNPRQGENSNSSEEIESLRAELSKKSLSLEEVTSEKAKLAEELNTLRLEVESLRVNSKDSSAMAKETIENLSQLITQKDQELAEKIREQETSFSAVKAERDELVKLVQVKHKESLQYHAEIQRLTQLFNEQVTNFQALAAEHEKLNRTLKDKEAEVLWAQNELQVVRQRLKNFEEKNNYGENCNIAEHASQLAQASILNEKCNALEAALVKEQTNNRLLQDQLTDSQNREGAAAKELERLRTHLVEMEANYTEETLLIEESRKELEAKLREAEEKVKNSSTVYTSASIRANQQVETLQQQMALIIQQRDDIQNKLSAAEDKVLAHTASLTNLQIVLEQFQRDKENDIRNATERIRQQLNASYKKQEELGAEILSLKAQLAEAKECLQAASRLSEQLDKKGEKIQELSQEVTKLTELVNTADERIQEAKKSGEGKVDKFLVKNLLLGFLSASTTDKSSVLRVFSTVLDFDEQEREKAGLNHPQQGGWFSGLLSSSGPPTKDQEASLSQAFIRFLETESKPSSVPALPESTRPISRPGHSRQHSTSSTQSGLLLTNVSLPSFPDFVPSRNTGSILKEVLKDS